MKDPVLEILELPQPRASTQTRTCGRTHAVARACACTRMEAGSGSIDQLGRLPLRVLLIDKHASPKKHTLGLRCRQFSPFSRVRSEQMDRKAMRFARIHPASSILRTVRRGNMPPSAPPPSTASETCNGFFCLDSGLVHSTKNHTCPYAGRYFVVHRHRSRKSRATEQAAMALHRPPRDGAPPGEYPRRRDCRIHMAFCQLQVEGSPHDECALAALTGV